ncbi:transmembrane protein 192-like [Amphiura filiformis]|uniref:transmembrane protein 192-like n=1 Tax=Amphiura filiformis TaxID=82378 RepID=UPI003B21B4A1
MVSLERESGASGRSTHGGYFFDHESALNTEDDEQHLVAEHLRTDSIEPHFQKLRTIPIAVGEALVLIIYATMPFLVPYVILPFKYKHFQKKEETNMLVMVCLQAAAWFAITIVTAVYQYLHIRHQRLGYLEFYRDTRVYKEVPGFIFSVGNAVILVVPVLVYAHNLTDPSRKAIMWPSNYFQIIFLVQVLTSLPCIIRYIYLVYQFNKEGLPPDIEVEEKFHMVSRPVTNYPQIGFKEVSYLDNLLERQADMILYLRRHSEDLSKRLLQLSNRHTRGQQMNNIP